jgi:ubiquinone/menaquinone biosynthesis C-methylase UbiE
MAEAKSFIQPEELWREVGLQAGQIVVHLGCGAGFYVVPAAKIVGDSGKVIGIDLLAPLLEETEGRAKRQGVSEVVHTIRANLDLPQGSTLAAASADWVLVANILHQSDPAAILAEAARIIRPAGKVAVLDWDVVATPLGPPAEVRVAPAVAKQQAEAAGLVVTKEWRPSPYHYGLLLRRRGAVTGHS